MKVLKVLALFFCPLVQGNAFSADEIDNICSCLDLYDDIKGYGNSDVIYVEPTTKTDVSLEECKNLCSLEPMSCKVR